MKFSRICYYICLNLYEISYSVLIFCLVMEEKINACQTLADIAELEERTC